MIEHDAVQAGLSDAAWQKLQAVYFSDGPEETQPPEQITAADGAIWTRGSLVTDEGGPGVSLTRSDGHNVTAFALDPAQKDIVIVKSSEGVDMEADVAAIEFQIDCGLIIPTGDDLRQLEEFLLPNG